MRRWLTPKDAVPEPYPWRIDVPEAELVDGNYMVIYRQPDGAPSYQQFADGPSAIDGVADLYSVQGIRNARMFVLNEISFTATPAPSPPALTH